MFGLGVWEIVVIAIVALLVLGPEKLPEMAKTIGKGLRELKRHTNELQNTVHDAVYAEEIRELRNKYRPPEIKPAEGAEARGPTAAETDAPPEGAPAEGAVPPPAAGSIADEQAPPSAVLAKSPGAAGARAGGAGRVAATPSVSEREESPASTPPARAGGEDA